MKITVKSEEKVGSKNHSAKRFCSTQKSGAAKVDYTIIKIDKFIFYQTAKVA